MVKKVFDNCLLPSRVKDLMSNIYTTRKRAARYMLFKLLVNGTLLSWIDVTGCSRCGRRGEGVASKQRCFLNHFIGEDELDMS